MHDFAARAWRRRALRALLALGTALLGACSEEGPASDSLRPAASELPRIEFGSGAARLELPAAMGDALRAFDPDFEVARASRWAEARYRYAPYQAPFAVIADLNGDQRPDVAALGASAGRPGLRVLLSEPRGGYAVRALAPPRGPAPRIGEDRLQLVLPSLIRSPFDRRTFRLENEAVEYIGGGGEFDLLYWSREDDSLRYWSLGN